MIRRHKPAAIFLHWFNAFCFLFLLGSGFAILGEPYQPLGMWWHDLWHSLFGAQGLIVSHIVVGCAWLLVFLGALIFRGRDICIPFIVCVTRFQPARDLEWCMKKACRLTIGPKLAKSAGMDTTLPPQGFYNAGQRIVAVLTLICGLGLALTGLALAFFSRGALSAGALQWCLLLHFIFAAIMAIFIPIHIYMAALAPGEGPALKSMFTGMVPREYARCHNPLWQADSRDS